MHAMFSRNMNFIAICLHCLDMRDFHSHLRDTPFLDELRRKSVFIPMGRGQGHHHGDSLNAELSGIWTARCSDSRLTRNGYVPPRRLALPTTIIEHMRDNGYETCVFLRNSWAVNGGMKQGWLREEPDRLKQFDDLTEDEPQSKVERIKSKILSSIRQGSGNRVREEDVNLARWLRKIKASRKKFYAHFLIRHTHRPWNNRQKLCDMLREPLDPSDENQLIRLARRASVEKPDELAALRREGLARADRTVERIFRETRHIRNTVYLVYSNHGEVFDHFRYHHEYGYDDSGFIYGTTHGNLPYEVLYANMQMWIIPGCTPAIIPGTGRSIDIPPTILDLAGISQENMHMDGESMLPYFFLEKSFPGRDRYAESWLESGCISMVREDGWKFVSTGSAPEEWSPAAGNLKSTECNRLGAFHLPSDPYEYSNLIDTPAGQSVLSWAVEKHASLGKIERFAK